MPRQKTLVRTGGITALVAGILFRRNIGAEVDIFTVNNFPSSAAEWFSLLDENPLVGLSFLAVFDLVNYILLGLMFLALALVLARQFSKAAWGALLIGLAGIVVGFIANNAFPMLSLSKQYTAASSAEQIVLNVAGEVLLTRGGASGSYQGLMMTISLFLIATAGLMFSILMLRGSQFRRVTAIFGFLASGLDLLYCATVLFLPTLAIILIAAAGLCYMIWHILIGLKLLKIKES